MSSLVYYLACLTQFKVLQIRGRGYQSFYVIVLSVQQLTQNLSPLLGFYIKRTSNAIEKVLTQIKPLLSRSRSVFLRTSSLSLDMLQSGLYEISSSLLSQGINLILQSTSRPQQGSNSALSFSKKSYAQSLRQVERAFFTLSIVSFAFRQRAFLISFRLATNTYTTFCLLFLRTCSQKAVAVIVAQSICVGVVLSLLCTENPQRRRSRQCLAVYSTPSISSNQVFLRIILNSYIDEIIYAATFRFTPPMLSTNSVTPYIGLVFLSTIAKRVDKIM